MAIDWTTVLASGLTASILASFQFIATRYLGKVLDRIEKDVHPKSTVKGRGKKPTSPSR